MTTYTCQYCNRPLSYTSQGAQHSCHTRHKEYHALDWAKLIRSSVQDRIMQALQGEDSFDDIMEVIDDLLTSIPGKARMVEIFVEWGGMYRWRAIGTDGRTLYTSQTFPTRASARQSAEVEASNAGVQSIVDDE